MVSCRNEVPGTGFLLNAECERNGVVLVVSSRRDDASLIAKLLERSGYLCETRHKYAASEDWKPTAKATGSRYVATVLCHRKIDLSGHGNPSAKRMPGERVIVFTDSTDENTVIGFLESGAHYVFNSDQSERLLQSRLEAALRQHSCLASRSFALGDIRFDVPKRRVFQKEVPVELSPKEFDLAYYLFSNRHRTVGNSELMTSIWSLPPSMDTRRIDTAACRLRKKLNLSASSGWELKRLRSVGYQLVPATQSDDAQSSDDADVVHGRFDKTLQMNAG